MLPPWHFRLAKALIRRGVRGPGLWLRLAHRFGWLNQVVTYQLAEGLEVDVPLSRWENLWDADEVKEYEATCLDRLASRLLADRSPATLVDCGADIGLFGLLLAMRGVPIAHLVALEPNPRATAVLRTNVSRLGAGHKVREQAVGDFVGRGKLVRPDYDPSEHAWHLVRDDAGPVEVTTVDTLDLWRDGPGRLILKIDVEGGELAVVRGAKETLRAAQSVSALIEAHPLVFRRTGVDPLEAVREIAALRPVEVHLAERPDLGVDLARSFFEQFPGMSVGNLIVEAGTPPQP